MILGWVDQIGRKGNIVYSSSCCLSFVPLSVYLTKEFTYEKKKQFPEQFQNIFSSQIYYLLPYL